MHIEIDRETDAADLAAIEAALARVLRDVRETVEDWPRMTRTASSIAEELAAAPPPSVPADEAAEAVELLHWLADNNFTFIGYREYDLSGATGEESLCGVSGTGLGILRSDTGPSRAFAQLPAAARSAAREPHVLVLTKANTRSTVHRNAYLDYIGIKRFDADGKVNGERRFLGLFTSAAYTQPVSTIPVVARKVRDVMARSGFRREGHSYKDLLRVLETYPRDELFQIDANTCTTPRSRCCTCRAAARPGCSCAGTRTAASSPRSCSSRETATPRRSGCAWSRRCGGSSAWCRWTTRPA